MKDLIQAHLKEKVNQLKAENNSPPREVLEAQKVIAQFEEWKNERIAKILRSELPYPAAEACPDCFLESRVSHMVCASPLDVGGDPDIDYFICKQCGLVLP